jgi:hypothetical protein
MARIAVGAAVSASLAPAGADRLIGVGVRHADDQRGKT